MDWESSRHPQPYQRYESSKLLPPCAALLPKFYQPYRLVSPTRQVRKLSGNRANQDVLPIPAAIQREGCLRRFCIRLVNPLLGGSTKLRNILYFPYALTGVSVIVLSFIDSNAP